MGESLRAMEAFAGDAESILLFSIKNFVILNVHLFYYNESYFNTAFKTLSSHISDNKNTTKSLMDKTDQIC